MLLHRVSSIGSGIRRVKTSKDGLIFTHQILHDEVLKSDMFGGSPLLHTCSGLCSVTEIGGDIEDTARDHLRNE